MRLLSFTLPWRAWGLALVLHGTVAHAQSEQRFIVTDMSKGSGVRLAELNAQAALARTTSELVGKLRSALSALDEGYVRFRERTGNGQTRHIYWIASNRVTTST